MGKSVIISGVMSCRLAYRCIALNALGAALWNYVQTKNVAIRLKG